MRTLESFTKLDSTIESIVVIPKGDDESLRYIRSKQGELPLGLKVVNDQNKGIYAAMNLGIANATGIFTIFLNAGDEISSAIQIGKFCKEVREIDENWAILQPSLSWSTKHIRKEGQLEEFFTLGAEVFVSHQSVLFRTDVLRKIGGYKSSYKVIGDTVLMFEFFKRGSPYMSSTIFTKVEIPSFASVNQRRSRLEFLFFVLTTYSCRLKRITIFNFLKREFRFILSKSGLLK